MGFFKKLLDNVSEEVKKKIDESLTDAKRNLNERLAEVSNNIDEGLGRAKSSQEKNRTNYERHKTSIQADAEVQKTERLAYCAKQEEDKTVAEVSTANADNAVFSDRIEALISAALQDGVLTDKERELLKRRVEKEGEDWDEVEMIIEARLAEMKPRKEATKADYNEPSEADMQKSTNINEPTSQSEVNTPPELPQNEVQDQDAIEDRGLIVYKNGKTDIFIEDCKVIFERSFLSNINVIKIVLPSKLKTIEKDAFSNCSYLQEVDFSKCTQLESIGKAAFMCCEKLETIIFPPELKTIEAQAFASCSSLKEIDFSKCNLLESIGQGAFGSCEKLGNIIFPPKLNTIEDGAFASCPSLQEIDMSQCTQLKSIGAQAFDMCSLQEIDMSKCTQLESIGYQSFNCCKKLERIIFPTNLKSIGDRAFEESNLIEVTIPDSVVHIGVWAFAKNEKLARATIGRSAKDYFKDKKGIFAFTPNLKELTFRSEVAEHTGARALTKVTFCDTVKELGKWAVSECEELEEVVLPDSITKIGYGAFVQCYNLSSIRLSDNITEIGVGALARTSVKEIVFPRELRKLEWLGGEQYKLRKLDFSKVTKLKTIPSGFIGEKTPKLKEIAFPIGVTKIGEDIGGENLSIIYLPPTIKEVEELHQVNIDIYCFSPAIEELGLMVDRARDIRLHVLPEFLTSYKQQCEAEGISEDILTIDAMPDEFRYYYDN